MPKSKVFSADEAITAAELNKLLQDDQILAGVGQSSTDIMSQKATTDNLDLKADKTTMISELAKKADKTTMAIELDKKADKTTMEAELAKKEDSVTVERTFASHTGEMNGKIALKADKATMSAELEKKADKTTMSAELDKKANQAETVAALETKADVAQVEADLATKADKTTVTSELAKKVDKTVSVNGKSLSASITLGYADVGAEPAFSKNSGFNKAFGSTSGTVCQGNDSRLTNSRTCNNSFDNAASARSNLGLHSVAVSGDYGDLKNKVSIVDNLTSSSASSALSANQGRLLNNRLNQLGFSKGAFGLTQTGVLNVSTTGSTGHYAPDGSYQSLGTDNHLIKCGKYVMAHLLLVGQSTTSGTQLAANTTFATIPSGFRPSSAVSVTAVFSKLYTWSTVSGSSSNSTTFGTAKVQISSSGNVTCNAPVIYNANSSAGKTGAGGSTTSGYVEFNAFWKI